MTQHRSLGTLLDIQRRLVRWQHHFRLPTRPRLLVIPPICDRRPSASFSSNSTIDGPHGPFRRWQFHFHFFQRISVATSSFATSLLAAPSMATPSSFIHTSSFACYTILSCLPSLVLTGDITLTGTTKLPVQPSTPVTPVSVGDTASIRCYHLLLLLLLL